MSIKITGPLRIALCSAIVFAGPALFSSAATRSHEPDLLANQVFQIKVVDQQTGRGVPLIELKTTNHLSYVTDSGGIVAFYEPGLVNQNVFFHISGHGYQYPKDGFGYRGKKLRIKPGGSATLEVKRINIAERLYRITGQGIYRDSIIAGIPVPLANPVINGLVMGQDSVQTCWYNNKLHWFWGDTAKPSYPLGHFATAGAVSQLPEQGGLDPSEGIDLHYFTDPDGFSRKMAPMSEPGMIWLDGIFTVRDSNAKQHMLAVYARMKSLGQAYERGLMRFTDETDRFTPITRGGPEFLLYSSAGHPFGIKIGPTRYYYFATPFPLAVRMRVQASWQSATNPNEYEVFTCLTESGASPDNSSESKCRWISSGKLLENWKSTKSDLIEALQKEKRDTTFLYDIETGTAVTPHGGSVYWNRYRRKWVMITVQKGAGPSYLGEVWYAESDTPLGPWGYAAKIVTHNSYSFYNPKQHPYFDRENGRLIYFEGTYSHTFSGRPEDATPRYDYNQIMYRLDLSDTRLRLPAPVYEVPSNPGNPRYLLGENLRSLTTDDITVNVAFYAIPPDRAFKGLTPLYADRSAKHGWTLTRTSKAQPAQPLFFAWPHTKSTQGTDKILIPLFEYTNKKTGIRRYSVDTLDEKAWTKSKDPLCRVWKNPAKTVLTDWKAQPSNEWEHPDPKN